MKIIANYKTRVLAEEAHNYLMSRGIPSVVYGESAILALKENFRSDPVIVAVQDEQEEIARQILEERGMGRNGE